MSRPRNGEDPARTISAYAVETRKLDRLSNSMEPTLHLEVKAFSSVVLKAVTRRPMQDLMHDPRSPAYWEEWGHGHVYRPSDRPIIVLP